MSGRSMAGWAAVLGGALAASACATPEVVQERQAGDAGLSCGQLAAEMEEAREFAEEAREARGVTTANVAAALFFALAFLATYINTEEAIEAANARHDHLLDIYEGKGCT